MLRDTLSTLRNEFQDSSRWLPPKVSLKEPKEATRQGPVSPYMTGRRNEINLDANELRFWAGSLDPTSRLGVCRSCNLVTYTETARSKHFKEFRCTLDARNAFAWLTSWSKCATCGGTQSRQRWGVPLCEGECEVRFMICAQPPAYGVALKAALGEDKDKRNPGGIDGKVYA